MSGYRTTPKADDDLVAGARWVLAGSRHANGRTAVQPFEQQRFQIFAAVHRTTARPGVALQRIGQPQRMTDDFAFVGEPAGINLPLDNALVIRRERETHIRDFPTSPGGCQARASP